MGLEKNPSDRSRARAVTLVPIPLPGWDPIPGAQRTPTTQNQNDVQISLANPITFRLACGFGAQGPSTDPAPGMGSRSRGMKPPNGPQRTQKRNYVQISLANPITFRLACGFGAQGPSTDPAPGMGSHPGSPTDPNDPKPK